MTRSLGAILARIGGIDVEVSVLQHRAQGLVHLGIGRSLGLIAEGRDLHDGPRV